MSNFFSFRVVASPMDSISFYFNVEVSASIASIFDVREATLAS